MSPKKVVVVGAGPVGSLAAIFAAVRGDVVEIYELRPDLRDPDTIPLNFSKSINLALSERGINSLRKTKLDDLVNAVLRETYPMHGRMIHVIKKGKYVQEPQLYDARGKCLLAMDRTTLNKILLDRLETMPNVTLHFSHKLVGVDFRKNLAWFEPPDGAPELELPFDFMIGADGAHSAVRYHMMKCVPMSYQQDYIDKLWCQFHVPPSPETYFRIPPHYLHIWPQDSSMFIALPNLDKTFTATLFATRDEFATLDNSGPTNIVEFFKAKFPGVVPNLITPDELIKQYTTNAHLPLITIKCTPYHYSSSGVILGDAAHAMVPFYGQGMNAGLEDVRVLFNFLDAYPEDRAEALRRYTEQRTPDAHAINDLALGNYKEMATDVKSPLYRIRKWIEETLDLRFPGLGWKTQYSRVTFGNMRYSEVRERSRRQASILNGVVGVLVVGAVGSAFWIARIGGLKKLERSVMLGICKVARTIAGDG